MISLDSITLSFGGFTLLDEVSLHIGDRDRIGLVGKNGAGKTTLLNLMAEKLRLPRTTPFNRTPFFDDFAYYCCTMRVAGEDTGYPEPLPYESRFISSDDVFEHILNLREQNDDRHIAAERAIHQWRQENTRSMKL